MSRGRNSARVPFAPGDLDRAQERVFESVRAEALRDGLARLLSHEKREISVFKKDSSVASQFRRIIAEKAAEAVSDGGSWMAVAEYWQPGGHGLDRGHVASRFERRVSRVDVEAMGLEYPFEMVPVPRRCDSRHIRIVAYEGHGDPGKRAFVKIPTENPPPATDRIADAQATGLFADVG